MFRVQDAILGDSPGTRPTSASDLAQTDADLIAALCCVGFVAGRVAVGHAIEFSWDPKGDLATREITRALLA